MTQLSEQQLREVAEVGDILALAPKLASALNELRRWYPSNREIDARVDAVLVEARALGLLDELSTPRRK